MAQDAQLRAIVQRMVERGESEDAIAEVVRNYDAMQPPTPAPSHEIASQRPRRPSEAPELQNSPLLRRLVEGAESGSIFTPAPAAAGQAGLRVIQSIARRLYGGLLKPSKATRQEFGDVVPGLLDKRRLITKGGADAAETAVDQSAKVADDMIANAPRPSQGVSANRVTSEFKDVLDAVKARVDAGVVPASELDKVAGRITRINQTANASGGRIDPVRAQTLKRTSQEAATGAYTQMQRGNAKMLSTDDLLDAATARGFKGGIEDVVPGIGAQNAKTQGLIGEARALTDAVGRTSNHLPFGSVSDLAAMMAGGAHPVLGVAGKAATMAGPGSAIAVMLNEASKLGLDEATMRALLAAGRPEQE